ncbi:MAG: helical backbone metal receptor [Bacteroidota bacterium]|nr:helical backbone metal receptor [Bacteroidota bacterium]
MTPRIPSIVRPVLVVLLLAQLTACHRPSHSPERPVTPTLVDDLGRTVRVDSMARRIVSLAPSLTEMLYAVGAGARIAGVTTYCDYPADVRNKPVIGDLLAPDIERILSLRPDLVVISVEGNSPRTFERLESLGLRIFVSNPRDIRGVLSSIRDIGILSGRRTHATALIDSLRRVQVELRARRPRSQRSVLLLLSLQPLMAAGARTFIGEVIAIAGARNAAAGLAGNYPILDRESLLRLDPDVILYPDDMGIDETRLRRGYPEWGRLRAVRGGRLYRIDADRFLRPGPRVFEAAAQLQELIRRVDPD